VWSSSLSVAVYDMSRPGVLAVSASAREQLGFSDVDIDTVDIVETSHDPDAVRQVIGFIRNGQLREWKWRSWLHTPDGGGFWDVAVGRALDVRGSRRRLGLVFYPTPGAGTTIGTGARRVREGCASADRSVGDGDGEVESLIAVLARELAAEEFIGLVHPDDVDGLITGLRHAAGHDATVATVVRASDSAGEWQRVHLTFEPAGEASERFATSPAFRAREDDGSRSDRVVELEGRLWRIAREIEAAELIPRGTRTLALSDVAGLEHLSARQREIVARLVRGERVATIATGLDLSASTVRNHLSAIFRKLGVRSQSELLEMLNHAGETTPH
jgi:DNA-binding CsgD family transcriptional regulator